jgi:hypothetical protein
MSFAIIRSLSCTLICFSQVSPKFLCWHPNIHQQSLDISAQQNQSKVELCYGCDIYFCATPCGNGIHPRSWTFLQRWLSLPLLLFRAFFTLDPYLHLCCSPCDKKLLCWPCKNEVWCRGRRPLKRVPNFRTFRFRKSGFGKWLYRIL